MPFVHTSASSSVASGVAILPCPELAKPPKTQRNTSTSLRHSILSLRRDTLLSFGRIRPPYSSRSILFPRRDTLLSFARILPPHSAHSILFPRRDTLLHSGKYFRLTPQPHQFRGIIQVRCTAPNNYNPRSNKRRASIENILYRRSSLYLLINYCLLSRLSLRSLFSLRSRLAHNLEWKFYGYFLVEAYYRCMST